jgi:hypothetical protein
VKPSDLLALLQDLHREKLALQRRHEAGAARVSAYNPNNTYQYVLAREATHLSWLRAAIEELGGVPDESGVPLEVPGGAKRQVATAVCEDDARRMSAFIDAWRPRIDGVSHARHRKMLGVVLGEAIEHQRFFAQAAAGNQDLLGRRPESVGTGGGVMSTRWAE